MPWAGVLQPFRLAKATNVILILGPLVSVPRFSDPDFLEYARREQLEQFELPWDP